MKSKARSTSERKRQKRREAENSPRLDEIKHLNGCQHCHGTNIPLSRLEFHHEGRFRWEIARRKYRAWPEIVIEMRETVLLCHRCHGWRHAGRIVLPDGLRVVVPAWLESPAPPMRPGREEGIAADAASALVATDPFPNLKTKEHQ